MWRTGTIQPCISITCLCGNKTVLHKNSACHRMRDIVSTKAHHIHTIIVWVKETTIHFSHKSKQTPESSSAYDPRNNFSFSFFSFFLFFCTLAWFCWLVGLSNPLENKLPASHTLTCNPQGKRNYTWQCSLEADTKRMRYTWTRHKTLVQDQRAGRPLGGGAHS